MNYAWNFYHIGICSELRLRRDPGKRIENEVNHTLRLLVWVILIHFYVLKTMNKEPACRQAG